jgi:hypothetical protein
VNAPALLLAPYAPECVERLSEKGPSEASKAASGIVRRAKRAENGAHGGPQGRAEVASGAFRTVSEGDFSEGRLVRVVGAPGLSTIRPSDGLR